MFSIKRGEFWPYNIMLYRDDVLLAEFPPVAYSTHDGLGVENQLKNHPETAEQLAALQIMVDAANKSFTSRIVTRHMQIVAGVISALFAILFAVLAATAHETVRQVIDAFLFLVYFLHAVECAKGLIKWR